MILRIVCMFLCLAATNSFSQGYSGDFRVSDRKTMFHFTLLNGSVKAPVYTIIEGNKHINTMYLSDSVVLSGIDSMTVLYKKDSLLKRYTENFYGTYLEYRKNGRILTAHHYAACPDSAKGICEDQRMHFYPNGKAYSQFYLKNGHPSRSVVYYTKDGEVHHIKDLSEYKQGEEVLIQNPWNFRMRKKMMLIVIDN